MAAPKRGDLKLSLCLREASVAEGGKHLLKEGAAFRRVAFRGILPGVAFV